MTLWADMVSSTQEVSATLDCGRIASYVKTIKVCYLISVYVTTSNLITLYYSGDAVSALNAVGCVSGMASSLYKSHSSNHSCFFRCLLEHHWLTNKEYEIDFLFWFGFSF